MGQPRNPRRRALVLLQSIGRMQRYLAKRWNQDQTVRDGVSGEWRERLPSEQLENQPAAWLELLQQLAQMQTEMNALRTYAYQQYQDLQMLNPALAQNEAPGRLTIPVQAGR